MSWKQKYSQQKTTTGGSVDGIENIGTSRRTPNDNYKHVFVVCTQLRCRNETTGVRVSSDFGVTYSIRHHDPGGGNDPNCLSFYRTPVLKLMRFLFTTNLLVVTSYLSTTDRKMIYEKKYHYKLTKRKDSISLLTE